jgi:cytochrome c biogenesis protein CcdA
MDWLHQLSQNNEFPIVAAFALGLLTAVSPCPLATNITAIAYISKTLNSRKLVLWSGFLYTVGRGISYTALGLILYWGASKFHIARFFQSKGEIYLAPILIIIGLIMLGVIKLNFLNRFNLTERFSEKYKDRGALGALILGILFALAFCPYSGALYFGMLIPMSISSPMGLYLPIVFALGTGIPVMLFAYLLAFGASKVGNAFNAIRKVETAMRYVAGGIFVVIGMYYGLIFLQWI